MTALRPTNVPRGEDPTYSRCLRSRCPQHLRLTGFEVSIGDDALVTERGKLGQLISYGAFGATRSLRGVLAYDGLIDRSAKSLELRHLLLGEHHAVLVFGSARSLAPEGGPLLVAARHRELDEAIPCPAGGLPLDCRDLTDGQPLLALPNAGAGNEALAGDGDVLVVESYLAVAAFDLDQGFSFVLPLCIPSS
jgi:hypothetical protein